jgi:hypothetical protein
MHFKRSSFGLARYVAVVKTSMMKTAWEDFILMILMQKILAILDKSLFESARSIAETLYVGLAIVLRCLYDFIGFRSFHLHWVPHILTVGLREKRIEYAQVILFFLHTADEIFDITAWLMMNRGFPWTHYHVACGFCRKIAWSQGRDMISRAKVHVHDHIEPTRFPCCRQVPKCDQNEQRLFCDKDPKSAWTSDLFSKKGGASETACVHVKNVSVDISRVSTSWLEEHGMPRMLHPPDSPHLAPGDFYLFPTVIEKLKRIQVGDED